MKVLLDFHNLKKSKAGEQQARISILMIENHNFFVVFPDLR